MNTILTSLQGNKLVSTNWNVLFVQWKRDENKAIYADKMVFLLLVTTIHKFNLRSICYFDKIVQQI